MEPKGTYMMQASCRALLGVPTANYFTTQGTWRRRLGNGGPSPTSMPSGELQWAIADRRLTLTLTELTMLLLLTAPVAGRAS